MPTPPVQRSVADVLQEIAGNVQEIIYGELRAAKVEVQEKISRTTAGACTGYVLTVAASTHGGVLGDFVRVYRAELSKAN